MSVYLGQDKIGVSYANNTSNMYDIQRSIMSDDVYTPWTRPEGWPDLDSLNLEMTGEESFIYMTYRTGHVDDFCSFHINRVRSSFVVELGTITNGEFVATSSQTFTSNSDVRYWFTSNEGYSNGTIVVKITGRIARFNLINSVRDSSLGGGTLPYGSQPMLERICYIPEVTSFNSVSSGSYTLERDKMNNGTGASLTSLYYAWGRCYNLQSLDISGVYTPNVTTMAYAFVDCKRLESINITHWNTAKITGMSYMFDGCQRLQELDLRNFDTQKLTGLAYTFRNCYALKEIKGLGNFYTNNVTNLTATFNCCMSLENLYEVSNWNTGNVTTINNLFSSCFCLKKINLSNWNVSKVTNIAYLFSNCYNLEEVLFPITQTDTLTGANNYIFQYCYNLQKVDLTWIKPITNAVTSISYLFYHCRSLKEINIPEGWDVTGCTASESFFRIFGYCYKLEKITGISNWDASNYNYAMTYMFAEDYSLKELNIKNWCPHPTSINSCFYLCRSLENLDLTGWHWENMTGAALGAAFAGCESLKDIKGIEHMGDSGNITAFNSIFSTCYSLSSIPDISSWNPIKVTTCASMFSYCRSLRSLTIKNWSLPVCTTISDMFNDCPNIEELELTNWSLPALNTAPGYIFYNLRSLKKCSGLPIGYNHRYQSCYSLPEDQWIRIFNQLPTVSNKTLQISTENINRLSSTTKAIATNKGWTLAN